MLAGVLPISAAFCKRSVQIVLNHCFGEEMMSESQTMHTQTILMGSREHAHTDTQPVSN